MRRVSLIILSIICTQVFANAATLHEIRSLYRKAADQEKSCKLLSELNVPNEGKDVSVLAGYKAAATMVMAKHMLNPVSKINYFRKGKKMLEKAILLDTKNVELRFLRFSIQTNAPSFLGYSHNIQHDKQFLTTAVPGIKDPELKNMVVSYLNSLKN